ncbi:NAD-dependent epimerase/dehydratase family protein [Micromonospora lupini]
MRVFVTGATGWIGSATVDELLAAGHDVVGLARSDTSAAALEAMGVTVRRGDLDDLDGIRAGAADAEAVIHLANKHDFDNPAVSNKAERAAIKAIGDTLEGSGRPSCSPRASSRSTVVVPPPKTMPPRSTAPTPLAAAARTSHWTTSPEACTWSGCGSPPPRTARATTAS